MEIVRWLKDGAHYNSWISSDGVIGGAASYINGRWCAFGENWSYLDPYEHSSEASARELVEWSFPSSRRPFAGWLESFKGGYFRQFARGQRVYVRSTDRGWYAVRRNGRVLGRAGKVVWFGTYEEAFAAVEQAMLTPADADPFRDKSNDWCWVKAKGPARAA